jgi:hypothetical protein
MADGAGIKGPLERCKYNRAVVSRAAGNTTKTRLWWYETAKVEHADCARTTDKAGWKYTKDEKGGKPSAE